MNNITPIKTLAIVGFATMISGCASTDPYIQEWRYSAKTIEIADEQEKLDVSYLARAIMSRNSRVNLENKLRSEHYERASALDTGFNVGIGAQMTTDIVVGQLSSSAGQVVGPAAFVVGSALGGIFSQMAAMDQASQFFVHAEVDGVAIETPEQASQAMYQALEVRINLFAKKRGFESKCIIGCDEGLYRFYHLKQVRDDAYDNYHYNPHMDETATRLSSQPGDLIVRIYALPMGPASDDPIRDSIIGFTPAWETPLGNTAFINIWTGVADSNGEPQIQTFEKGEIKEAPAVTRSLSGLQMGREFYAEIYDSDLAAFYFDENVYPHEGFFKGKVYSWILANDHTFIKYYLDLTPPTFADATQAQ